MAVQEEDRIIGESPSPRRLGLSRVLNGMYQVGTPDHQALQQVRRVWIEVLLAKNQEEREQSEVAFNNLREKYVDMFKSKPGGVSFERCISDEFQGRNGEQLLAIHGGLIKQQYRRNFTNGTGSYRPRTREFRPSYRSDLDDASRLGFAKKADIFIPPAMHGEEHLAS